MFSRHVVIAFVLNLLFVPQLFSSSDRRCKACQLPQDEMSLLGNVSVRSAFNGNIVVIVDQFNRAPGASEDERVTEGPALARKWSNARGADGIPDFVFRFAPKEREQYPNVAFDLQSAKVFFTTRHLAVISNDGHVMVSLSLEEVRKGDPFFAVYGDDSTDLPNTVRTSSGIGLRREGTKRAADGSLLPIDMEKDFIDRAKQRDPVLRTESEEDPDQGICSAGGYGSTSCSIQCGGGEGCSVGCSSGYYSCCTCGPTTCRCRPN